MPPLESAALAATLLVVLLAGLTVSGSRPSPALDTRIDAGLRVAMDADPTAPRPDPGVAAPDARRSAF